jgi:hypothetical protein
VTAGSMVRVRTFYLSISIVKFGKWEPEIRLQNVLAYVL